MRNYVSHMNAGAEIVFDGDHAIDTYIDGSLITGRHPGVVEEFMAVNLAELKRRRPAEG